MISIPFRPDFKEALLSDRKTATTRTKPYGKAGDRFWAVGALFELQDVSQVSLSFVAHGLWREEGLSSSEEFMHVWKQIHPLRGYDPDQRVWLHRFKRLR